MGTVQWFTRTILQQACTDVLSKKGPPLHTADSSPSTHGGTHSQAATHGNTNIPNYISLCPLNETPKVPKGTLQESPSCQVRLLYTFVGGLAQRNTHHIITKRTSHHVALTAQAYSAAKHGTHSMYTGHDTLVSRTDRHQAHVGRSHNRILTHHQNTHIPLDTHVKGNIFNIWLKFH